MNSFNPPVAHQPVLLQEVVNTFLQSDVNPPKNYLDGTFGQGGHAWEIYQNFKNISIYALDKDKEALLSTGVKNLKKQTFQFYIEQASFRQIDEIIREKNWPQTYEMILLDLGVSSPQLDQGSRGFSFYHEGPLDMRMDQSNTLTAKDIINSWSEDQLADLFRFYGEAKFPHKVAQSIGQKRSREKIETTQQLSQIIEKSLGWKKRGKHPATKYFMALRLFINQELEDLKEALPVLIEKLSPQGRLVVLTFHSLEDRIVKYTFKNSPWGQPLYKKVIKPSVKEKRENSRCHSAQLRAFVKKPKRFLQKQNH